MKKATVIMPITGHISIPVEVDDDATDEDAIDAAGALIDEGEVDESLATWEYTPKVVEGNVVRAEQVETEVVWE